MLTFRRGKDGSTLLGVSDGSVPSSSATFFCTSMMCSARCKRVRNCSFSWRSLAISAAWGSGFGPRFCGVSACRCRIRAVCATCQGATGSSPSRRSRAPIWPRSVQASASAKMRCLYSALNRRRSAFGITCGSGGVSSLVWAWVPLDPG